MHLHGVVLNFLGQIIKAVGGWIHVSWDLLKFYTCESRREDPSKCLICYWQTSLPDVKLKRDSWMCVVM